MDSTTEQPSTPGRMKKADIKWEKNPKRVELLHERTMRKRPGASSNTQMLFRELAASFKSNVLQRSSRLFCIHHDCPKCFISGRLWFSDGYISLSPPPWILSSQAPATRRLTKGSSKLCSMPPQRWAPSKELPVGWRRKVCTREELGSVIVAD